jgi:hypothetical protein
LKAVLHLSELSDQLDVTLEASEQLGQRVLQDFLRSAQRWLTSISGTEIEMNQRWALRQNFCKARIISRGSKRWTLLRYLC